MSGERPAIEVKRSREGPIFKVKVEPGASRTCVRGVHAGGLKVAVQAPPEKGKANDALVRFLSSALACSRGELEVVSGASAREKHLLWRGADPDVAAARLLGLAAPGGEGEGARGASRKPKSQA